MLTLEEMDSLTRKLWADSDPGEDPYCCTPMRHNLISAIRSACGLDELGERESTNPVLDAFSAMNPEQARRIFDSQPGTILEKEMGFSVSGGTVNWRDPVKSLQALTNHRGKYQPVQLLWNKCIDLMKSQTVPIKPKQESARDRLARLAQEMNALVFASQDGSITLRFKDE